MQAWVEGKALRIIEYEEHYLYWEGILQSKIEWENKFGLRTGLVSWTMGEYRLSQRNYAFLIW